MKNFICKTKIYCKNHPCVFGVTLNGLIWLVIIRMVASDVPHFSFRAFIRSYFTHMEHPWFMIFGTVVMLIFPFWFGYWVYKQ